MRKILKATTKKKFNKMKQTDYLYSKNFISIDDPKNQKYLDNIVYQDYLKTLSNESSDFYE